MPFPLIAAMIGAGATLGSGILANRANQQAQQYNQQIDLMNFYLRQQERRDAIRYADQARRDQQLGSVDANGTRTYFDPVRGWVTELTPEMQELLDMQKGELRQQLTNDLPRRRQILNQNVERQNEENYVAGGLLNEFRGVQREDPNAIRQQLIAAGAHGTNRAYDDALGEIFRSSIRSGASNTGRVVEDVNRQRADQLQKLFLDAMLSSQDIADQRYNNKRGQAANLYNLFAERSGRMPDVSYSPAPIDSSANALLGQFANREQQGISQGMEARGMRGGEMNFIEPNYAWANTIGALGSQISGGIRDFGAQRQEDDMNQILMQYLTRNGNLNMLGGGSYAPLLQNQGVF